MVVKLAEKARYAQAFVGLMERVITGLHEGLNDHDALYPLEVDIFNNLAMACSGLILQLEMLSDDVEAMEREFEQLVNWKSTKAGR